MPETFQSLAVLIVALLPGALYVWAFERYAGAWGVKLSDRLFRFVGFSALMHALIAPITYRLWLDFIESGRLGSGVVPIAIWIVPLAYVLIPVVAGSFIGRGTRERKRWATLFTGPDPAPRAWDHLFGSSPDGWVRLRLKSGTWIAGAFARKPDGSRSYAAGYPEDQDLYLLEAVEVDPDTGSFISGRKERPCREVRLSSFGGTRSSISTSSRREVTHGREQGDGYEGARDSRWLSGGEQADLRVEAATSRTGSGGKATRQRFSRRQAGQEIGLTQPAARIRLVVLPERPAFGATHRARPAPRPPTTPVRLARALPDSPQLSHPQTRFEVSLDLCGKARPEVRKNAFGPREMTGL